eukprot:358866-Chlamydomonas_euryale.AAC.8
MKAPQRSNAWQDFAETVSASRLPFAAFNLFELQLRGADGCCGARSKAQVGWECVPHEDTAPSAPAPRRILSPAETQPRSNKARLKLRRTAAPVRTRAGSPRARLNARCPAMPPAQADGRPNTRCASGPHTCGARHGPQPYDTTCGFGTAPPQRRPLCTANGPRTTRHAARGQQITTVRRTPTEHGPAGAAAASSGDLPACTCHPHQLAPAASPPAAPACPAAAPSRREAACRLSPAAADAATAL